MIKVFKDPDAVLFGLAENIVAASTDAIRQRGKFNFVLSGGSSPKKLFELLASPGFRTRIDWTSVFFFFGDERFVPADHPDSNYRMAKLAFLDALNIPAGQVFKIDTSLEPSESARAYEVSIRKHFGEFPCRFDLILLGLGDDAHTASLFPHTPVLHERHALVKENYVEKLKAMRITLTYPLINASHGVAFLVYGPTKAEAIKLVVEGNKDLENYPAQGIHPEGDLNWFVDDAAASSLTKK